MNTWLPMLQSASNQKPWKPPSTDQVKKRRHSMRSVDILKQLEKGRQTRNEIAEALELPAITIYKDLVMLEDEGKVEGRKRGSFILWQLSSTL